MESAENEMEGNESRGTVAFLKGKCDVNGKHIVKYCDKISDIIVNSYVLERT